MVFAYTEPRRCSSPRRLVHSRIHAVHDSHSCEPFEAFVFPVTTRFVWREDNFGQILYALVAELNRGIETKGSSVIGSKRMSIHPVGEHGLRMQSARQVPARPITAIERAELHIFNSGIEFRQARNLAHSHTVPRRYSRPPVHTIMPYPHLSRRQSLELIKRLDHRMFYQSPNCQTPV